MSAEPKTADGVPAAQARATLFPRSTLIRIVARFGLLGVHVLLGILAAFISAANRFRYRDSVALTIGWIGNGFFLGIPVVLQKAQMRPSLLPKRGC